MKLPKRFRDGDIVEFENNYVCPLGRTGSADICRGTIGRIEKILYNTPRNNMFDLVHISVVVAVMVGEKAEYITMTMEWAQEILKVKQAATVLYGDK